jgi:hypothetical protein
MKPLKDRRRRRSGDVLKALELFLDSVCDHFGLISLVLGDDQGLLVAGSSYVLDAEELAARAPLVQRKTMPPSLHGWPLQVWRFNMDEASLRLCAVGDERKAAVATFEGSRGVRRILSHNPAGSS